MVRFNNTSSTPLGTQLFSLLFRLYDFNDSNYMVELFSMLVFGLKKGIIVECRGKG